MDLLQPYLRDQLIAYIGSKRSLLPFLHGVLAPLVEDVLGSRTAGPARPVSFQDPFAGTGAVSRLARVMGLTVGANDWEPYAFVINSCHLGVSATEARLFFRARGGLSRAIAELNETVEPAPSERYISRHPRYRARLAGTGRRSRP